MSTEQSTEEFRAVPGHPGYEVSNLGRVRSYWTRGVEKHIGNQPRLLRPFKNKLGYLAVTLAGGRKKSIHRLVLETFVGPCPDGMEARHVNDNNPANNRLSNLCWGTRQENCDDKKRHGTHKVGSQ